MKKKSSTLLVTLMILVGLSLLLYPYIANKWNSFSKEKSITKYNEIVAEKIAAGEIDCEAERKKAEDYNQSLLPSILPDSFAIAAADEETDEIYMSCLNLTGDGIMGLVSIPKINVELPIYHTTSHEVLEKAAGHLEGSTLPIGGADTHAVISAHRGLPSAALFTDLDLLVEGDHFYIYVLDEILCYEVDQIQVVKPSETQALSVEEGQDLVTLMTCTPYGVNSHRLFVRGHRVPYEGNELQQEDQTGQISWHTNYLLWVVIALIIVGCFSSFLYWREKKMRKQIENKEETKDIE